MRILRTIILLGFFACGTKKTMLQNNPAIDMMGQEGTIKAHVITRGKFQYAFIVPSGENAGEYLPENDLAEEFCQDGLKVQVDAQLLRKKGAIYKPGPTDIPEKDFEVPVIKILAIKKL